MEETKIKEELAPKQTKEKTEDDKKGGKKARGLKTPKGTRDYDPLQMAIREKVFAKIVKCFKRHGAVTIETPLFELKEILTGKYGEDSKLIYDLQDQGGELCSLRYDLTVPFARYCAMNRVQQIKRYQIGRVYRRDNPVMNKGRFREFYQCDFDIAGEYDLMVPDAEAVKLITEVLKELNVGKYILKINHRQLLDGIFELCGVPEEKFRAICSAVDKLDKSPWDEVRKEMVDQKGLSSDIADKIWSYVQLNGSPLELLKRLHNDSNLMSNTIASKALEELSLLFDYAQCYGALDHDNNIILDLSLARGLDYYTGVIFEAVLTGTSQVGSIVGGGRYDNLIGIFGGKIPAVGFSVGVERIFAIMEEQAKKSPGDVRLKDTEVLVVSVDKGQLRERMKICKELWDSGIKAELLQKENPKPQQQLKYAEEYKIPLAIVFGQSEIQANTVQLKDLNAREQVTVPRDQMVSVVQSKLQQLRATNNQ